MIPGVEIRQLKTNTDERGFFREIARANHLPEGFAQLNHSVKNTGYYTDEFHVHQYQVDWWYIPIGRLLVVLADLRPDADSQPVEILPSDDVVLKIPPGVAHGLKVLEGPAHLFYFTSQVYNPADEDRVKLDYDWSSK